MDELARAEKEITELKDRVRELEVQLTMMDDLAATWQDHYADELELNTKLSKELEKLKRVMERLA